jgi:hypothetical protein
VFVFNTSRVGRHIAGWFVENMNPDVTPYRMLLDYQRKTNLKKDARNI